MLCDSDTGAYGCASVSVGIGFCGSGSSGNAGRVLDGEVSGADFKTAFCSCDVSISSDGCICIAGQVEAEALGFNFCVFTYVDGWNRTRGILDCTIT